MNQTQLFAQTSVVVHVRQTDRQTAVDWLCSGPRQQLNQLTSYLDASSVYGSTKDEADKLRNLIDYSKCESIFGLICIYYLFV